jgi:hypothetical protein
VPRKKPKKPAETVLVIDGGTGQEVYFPRTFLKEHHINVLQYRDHITVKTRTMRKLLERRLVTQ